MGTSKLNCQGNLKKYWGVTCDGLASHPGGVAILLVASCYRNRDKLRQSWVTRLVRLKGPVLPIMLHAPLLLFWFSRERVVYCFLVLFALQTIESSEFSTSQKWPPSYHSAQCLMGNTGSLTQPNSMKQLVETGLLCSQTRHFTLTVPLSIRDGRSGGGDGGWRLVSLELPQFL